MDTARRSAWILASPVVLLTACAAPEEGAIGAARQALNADLGNQMTLLIPIDLTQLPAPQVERVQRGPFAVMVAIDEAGGSDRQGLPVGGACVGWRDLLTGAACAGSGSGACLSAAIPRLSGVQVRVVVQSVAGRDTPLFVLAQGEARCPRPLDGRGPAADCAPDARVSRWVSLPVTMKAGAGAQCPPYRPEGADCRGDTFNMSEGAACQLPGRYCKKGWLSPRCEVCQEDGACGPACTPCAGAAPRCKPEGGSGRCVACVNDAHCGPAGSGRFCDLATNTCEACDQDARCGPSCAACTGTTPRCKPEGNAGRCVACLHDAQCGPAGSGRFCDLATNTCKACDQDARCGPACAACAGATPYCKPSGTSGACVACVNDAQCGPAGSGRFCDLTTGTCKGCTVDARCGLACAACTGARPRCSTPKGAGASAAVCVACLGDDDCPGGPAQSTCVNSTCQPSQPPQPSYCERYPQRCCGPDPLPCCQSLSQPCCRHCGPIPLEPPPISPSRP